MEKFNYFSGRKIVKSPTRQGLIEKMKKDEERGWRLVGKISQYNFCGHWLCVMEFPSKKGVEEKCQSII